MAENKKNLNGNQILGDAVKKKSEETTKKDMKKENGKKNVANTSKNTSNNKGATGGASKKGKIATGAQKGFNGLKSANNKANQAQGAYNEAKGFGNSQLGGKQDMANKHQDDLDNHEGQHKSVAEEGPKDTKSASGDYAKQKGEQVKNKIEEKGKEKGKKEFKKQMEKRSQKKLAEEGGKQVAKQVGKEGAKQGAQKGAAAAGKSVAGGAIGSVGATILIIIGIIIAIILIFFFIFQWNEYKDDETFSYESVLSERYSDTSNLVPEFANVAEMVYYQKYAQSSYTYTSDKVEDVPSDYDESFFDNKFDTDGKIVDVTANESNIYLDGIAATNFTTTQEKEKLTTYKVNRKNATTFRVTGAGHVEITKDGVTTTYNLGDNDVIITLKNGDKIFALDDAQAVVKIGPTDKENKEEEILLPYTVLGFLNEELFNGMLAPEVFLNPVYTNCADGIDADEVCNTLPLTDDSGKLISPTKVMEDTGEGDLTNDLLYDDYIFKETDSYCVNDDGTSSGGELSIDENGVASCSSGNVNYGVESFGFAPLFDYVYGDEYEHSSDFSVADITGATLINDDGVVQVDSSGNPLVGTINGSAGNYTFSNGTVTIPLDEDYSIMVDYLDSTNSSLDNAELDPGNRIINGWTVMEGMPSEDVEEAYLISHAATFLGSFSVDVQMSEENKGTTTITSAVDYSSDYANPELDKTAIEDSMGANNNLDKVYTFDNGEELATNEYCQNYVQTIQITKADGTVINEDRNNIQCTDSDGNQRFILSGTDFNETDTIEEISIDDYYYPYNGTLSYGAESSSPLMRFELVYNGDMELDAVYDYAEDWTMNLKTMYFTDNTIQKENIATNNGLASSLGCASEDISRNQETGEIIVGAGCANYEQIVQDYGYDVNWEDGRIDNIFTEEDDNASDDINIDDSELADFMMSDEEKQAAFDLVRQQNPEGWESVQVWSNAYGLDPYLLLALLMNESTFNQENHLDGCYVAGNGGCGIGQIENLGSTRTVTAYNQEKNKNETFTLNFGAPDSDEKTLDLQEQDDNIHAAAMMLSAQGEYFAYNPLAMILGYNSGTAGAQSILNFSYEYSETGSYIDAYNKKDSVSDKALKNWLEDGQASFATDGSTLWYSGATSDGWDSKWNNPVESTPASGCSKYESSGICYINYNDNGDNMPSVGDGYTDSAGGHGDPLYLIKLLQIHYYGDVPYVFNKDGDQIFASGVTVSGNDSIWDKFDKQIYISANSDLLARSYPNVDDEWVTVQELVYGITFGQGNNGRMYSLEVAPTESSAINVNDRILADYAGVNFDDVDELSFDESLILISFIGDSEYLKNADISSFLNQIFFDTDFSPVLTSTEDENTTINELVDFGRDETGRISKGIKLDTSCESVDTKSCYDVNAATSGVIEKADNEVIRINHGYVYKESEDKYVKTYTEYENVDIDSDIKVASNSEQEAFDHYTLCKSAEEQGNTLEDCTDIGEDAFAGIDEKAYVESGDKIGTVTNSDVIRGEDYKDLTENDKADRNANLFEFSYTYDDDYYNPELLISAMQGLLEAPMDGGVGGDGSADNQTNQFLEDNGCSVLDVFGKDCGLNYEDDGKTFEATEDTWLDPFDNIASWTLTDYAGHDGQDGNYPDNTPLTHPIYPVNNGVVTTVIMPGEGSQFYCSAIGQTVSNSEVRILHYDEDTGLNYTTQYLHMDGITVHPGQVVTQDTIIGYEGDVGCSTGQHIHYDVGQGYGVSPGDTGVYEPAAPPLQSR